MKKGMERGPHRSLFKAMGYTDEEISRPLIGVVNSANEIIPGHIHLDTIAEAVKAGIRMAGGTPVEFPSIGVCDGIAMNHPGMKYSLPSREVIADSVEIMAGAHPFDGLVLIPNCDKIIPGMLMAAARLNIPSIVMSGGPMIAGKYKGKRLDLVTGMFEGVGKVKAGQITEEDFREMEDVACPSCGSCAGMFTANTMNCLTEALGMGLPGNGTILAVKAARIRLAKNAGVRIMELVKNQVLPGKILMRQAFANAIAVDLALGGSTNTVLHLLAVAREAGVALELDDFEKMSRSTPYLCSLSPGGVHFIEDLDDAGGIPALMKVLSEKKLIDMNSMTVTGKTVGENLKGVSVRNPEVIRGWDNVLRKEGGIAILRGNIAPDGSVVKQSAVAEDMLRHQGPARVFDSEEDATQGILGGKIKKGDIVVVRYEGPRGGPGMREMLSLTSAIQGMAIKEIALITDGRFSGGTRGAAIGHIAPEAAEGGPIAALKDGDIISIDIPERKLEVKLTSRELSDRLAKWKKPEPKVKSSFLLRYAEKVSSAIHGAVLTR